MEKADLKTVCRELLKLKELGDCKAVSRPEYHARKVVIFKRMRELTDPNVK